MIGKIIGGIVGAKMAKDRPGGLEGPGGALLGIGAAALARRLSLPAMLALAAGGYAFKRYQDKQAKRPRKPRVKPSAA
jgi:hypothetical protein